MDARKREDAGHVAMVVPIYKDPARGVDERVEDLLGRMTLEEKVAQMLCVWQGKPTALVDEQGRFDPAKARAAFASGDGIGQVGRPSDTAGGRSARQMAELTNDIQRFFVEETRLGIPVIFHEECLHGHAAPEGTSFPQPIGLAATFDPGLVERVYTVTAAEARARGAHQALAPDLDVARDPRWGRTEETFGEDPYLIARLGVAAVRGFQGDTRFADKTRMVATVKHFAAHGQPESGTNCAPVNVSARVLRDVFLPAFKSAIVEGGALSVMPSYNEIDGVPSHANRWLLGDVLRKEWGFRGFIVSDYFAIREMNDRPGLFGHHVAHDGKEAAALAVRAGVDIELPDPDCYPELAGLVREGAIDESLIDDRVRPMLRVKFLLGLFDDPYVDPAAAERIVREPSHRDLAFEAATKTIALLKNDGGLLPLDPAAIRTIAVIGPNADRVMLGGYSGVPLHFSTVLQAIRERMSGTPGRGGEASASPVEVLYHEGCKVTIGGSWSQDDVTAADPEENRRSIARGGGPCRAGRRGAAGRRRQRADVAGGLGQEPPGRPPEPGPRQGSRTTWSMPSPPRASRSSHCCSAGGPRRRSISSKRRRRSSNSGTSGRRAAARLPRRSVGDVNPGGKLPITIPRSAGHIPAYYSHKPSARRGYLFESADPLFAFGYGLSYTTFRFSNLRLETAEIAAGETARVAVDVANTGTRAGDEVVQLYVRDEVSSVTRPVKELKGFRRVSLGTGRVDDGDIRRHARPPRLPRHRHGVPRRARHLPAHGRILLARRGPADRHAPRWGHILK